MRFCFVAVAVTLLVLALPSGTAAKKKKRRVTVPAVPSEYGEEGSCPYHVPDAPAKELSEFGHELERDGRQQEALRCYAQAVRTMPKTAIGWFDLAVARQYEEPSLALRFYAHGVTLDPTSFHHNQLGVMLRQAGRQDEASHRFTQAARLAPADADPLFNLGGTRETEQRYGEALHAYRGALDRERKNEARIQNNIGNVLCHQKKWAEALTAYTEAEEADPDFPETHQNLGHVLTVLERREEADRHLATAARLLPLQAANLTQQREENRAKLEERKKSRRQMERREEVDKRDGHLTREERVDRFQQVVGICGMDKARCVESR